MARSRNIKPGFFVNETMGDLDPLTRLLFIGLWTLADREGRLEDRPRRIHVSCLPYDQVNVDSCLDQLQTNNFIHRYVVNNQPYIEIINWRRHQNPHHKEVVSLIPEIPKEPQQKQTDIHDQSKLDSSMDQASLPNTDTTVLIPDSLNLIPDSSDKNIDFSQDEKPTTAKPTDKPKPKKPPPVPYGEIVDLYHEILPELPRVEKLTPKRKTQIKTLWREDMPELKNWRNFFAHVRQSDFLMGKKPPSNGHRQFRADIEWLTNQTNATNIAEQKYHGD